MVCPLPYDLVFPFAAEGDLQNLLWNSKTQKCTVALATSGYLDTKVAISIWPCKDLGLKTNQMSTARCTELHCHPAQPFLDSVLSGERWQALGTTSVPWWREETWANPRIGGC